MLHSAVSLCNLELILSKPLDLVGFHPILFFIKSFKQLFVLILCPPDPELLFLIDSYLKISIRVSNRRKVGAFRETWYRLKSSR